MSRNNKIRQMAEQLPDMPKVTNRRVQRDGSGKVIMANHFRELKAIQDKFGAKTQLAFTEMAKYTLMVNSYHQRKLKREKQIFYGIWAFVIIAVVAVILTYWR